MLSSFLVSNVVIRCHLRASSSQRCKAGGKWQKSWHFRTLESCSKTALAVEVKTKEAFIVNNTRGSYRKSHFKNPDTYFVCQRRFQSSRFFHRIFRVFHIIVCVFPVFHIYFFFLSKIRIFCFFVLFTFSTSSIFRNFRVFFVYFVFRTFAVSRFSRLSHFSQFSYLSPKLTLEPRLIDFQFRRQK